MKRFASALLTIVYGLSLTQTTSAYDDISHAYAQVKPALVKVWAFDTTGVPFDSGTGFVVQSDANQSWIVTATHVVDGASAVKIDVSRELYDLPASVVAATIKRDDITLLLIHHGGLAPVQFAAASQSMAEGKFVATAGYFQNDEQIGATGEAPKLVGPGTVGSLQENGNFIGINLGVEEGLSGAPVFDSNTGDVVGVVDVKSAVGTGGYAISAPLIVLGFLSHHRVSVPGGIVPIAVAAVSPNPPPVRVAPTPSPTPTRVAVAYVAPSPPPTRAPPTPSPAPTRVAVAYVAPSPPPTRAPPTPSPAPTRPAQIALAPVPLRTPAFVPTQSPPAAPSSAVPVGKANPRDVDECFGRVGVSAVHLVAACTNLLALTQSNAFLYDRRCTAYFRQKKSDLAIADCTQALRISPDDSIAYEYRAGAYNQKKRYDLALADAEKALKINPNSASAYTARGFAYEFQGILSSRQLALDDYNKAVVLNPNLSFYIASITHMPFNRVPLPPTSGFFPAGFASLTRFNGIYYRGQCGGASPELYNDFTVPIYFDIFNEPVRVQKDADTANWTKFGRIRLNPGETKTLSFANCVRGYTNQWHFWLRNLRFGIDEGPVLLPSTDQSN